jgi:hypothetical protein
MTTSVLTVSTLIVFLENTGNIVDIATSSIPIDRRVTALQFLRNNGWTSAGPGILG